MKTLLSNIRKKVNHIIWAQVGTGVFLLIMAVLIVWVDFFLELMVGLIVIMVSYVFFYGAYKLWSIKKEVEKYFKL